MPEVVADELAPTAVRQFGNVYGEHFVTAEMVRLRSGSRWKRVRRKPPKTAESELRETLRWKVDQAEQTGLAPATIKQLFEACVGDLEARGKGPETIARAAQTATTVEAVYPELLAKPVDAIREADIFAFRAAMAREGRRLVETVAGERVVRRGPAKPSTINRDLRTLRAMFKKARPGYRFPGGAFFPEDETRVRWLKPEEEILALEPMRSPFREMAKLAALTLMRLSEIRLLRREQVHLGQGVVLLPQAKAGARPVILSDAARKILEQELAGRRSRPSARRLSLHEGKGLAESSDRL